MARKMAAVVMATAAIAVSTLARGADAAGAEAAPYGGSKGSYLPNKEYYDYYGKYDPHHNVWHDEPHFNVRPKEWRWDKSNGKYKVGNGRKPHPEYLYKDYGYWPRSDKNKFGPHAQKLHHYNTVHRNKPTTFKYGQKYPIPKSLKKGAQYTQPFEPPSTYGRGWAEYVSGQYGLRNTGKYATSPYKEKGYYGPAYKPFQSFKIVEKEDYVPPYVHIGKGSPVSPYYGALDPLYKKQFQEFPGSPKYLHELWELQNTPYGDSKFFQEKNYPYQIVKQARPDFWDYSYKTDFGAEKRKFYSWGPGDYYAGDYSVPISISIGDEGFTCNIGYTDMLNPLAWKRCLSYPSGGQKYTKADLALDLNKFIDDGTLTREQAELIVETFEEPETSTISKPRDRPDKESRAYLPGYWNPGYYKVPVYSKYPGYYAMRYPQRPQYYSKYAGWSPKYGKWIPRPDQRINLHEPKATYVPGLIPPPGVHYSVFDKYGKYDYGVMVSEKNHSRHGYHPEGAKHNVYHGSENRPYEVKDYWGIAKYYNKWSGHNVTSNETIYKFLPAYYKGTLDDTNPFWMPRAALWAPAYTKATFYPGYLKYFPNSKMYSAYILQHPIDLPDPKDLDWKVRAFGGLVHPGYKITHPGTYTYNIYESNYPGVYGFKSPFTKYKTRGYLRQETTPEWGPKYNGTKVKGWKGEGGPYERALGNFWNNYKYEKHGIHHLPPKRGVHAGPKRTYVRKYNHGSSSSHNKNNGKTKSKNNGKSKSN